MQACRDIQYEQPAVAVTYALQALAIAKKMKDADKLLHALRMIGICRYAANDFLEAHAAFTEALVKYRRRKDATGESRALQNVGLALRGMGRNEEALQAYRNSEQILRKISDEEILVKVLNNIGSVCVALSRPADALGAFGECLMIAERRTDQTLVARVMGNVADVYMFVGDPEISLNWSRKALDQHRLNGDLLGVGITLANMSRVFQSQGDYANALAVSTESLAVMTSLKDASGVARSMIALAELYNDKKHFDQAATFAQEALDIFTHTHDVDRALRCMLILARIACHRKNFTEALGILKKARQQSKETDNHPLHIDIEVISSTVATGQKNISAARKHLLAAAKIASSQGVTASIAEIYNALAILAETSGDPSSALKYERQRAAAQQLADNLLRARHGQALQLRLEIEREHRAREIAQHQNEHLAFSLESKNRELSISAIAIAQKNELLSAIGADLKDSIEAPSTNRLPKLKALLRIIDGHRRNGEDWKNLTEQLNNVHDDFFRSLAQKCPSLSSTEIKLASLLKLNLTSKEIAEILTVSLQTIEVYRHRLRKKLDIPPAITLTTYFQGLG